MVVGMTTAVGRTIAVTFGMTTTEIIAIIATVTTVAELIRTATGIAVMAITISAATLGNVICVIASTRESTIEHPTKVIAVWNMTLPMARRV
jgi:hypothetical protein